MCGIAGVIDSAAAVEPAVIHRMCRAMQHRGPDSRGVHVEDGVGLGAQRLAIIDVAHGGQPVYNETRDVALVFNGEIYNYRELRRDLVRRGHQFSSSVDTEVVVHLYEDHGAALVHRLRGMFAFAIWDRGRRRLLCARDRAGKKPFYWARRGSRFSFASELPALLEDEAVPRVADPSAIRAYLGLQYVPHPLCAIRNVHKLPPASTLILDFPGRERIERYWRLRFEPKQRTADRRAVEEELRWRIDEATRIRLEAEAPVGALLSGGIDSSAVVSAMARNTPEPVKTFAVGFEDVGYDETEFARRVARQFGTDHEELHLRPDALAIMPRIARHHGEPFGDSSAVPSFHVTELVAQTTRVLFTGDGGDESFGGYNHYLPPTGLARIGQLPHALRRRPAHWLARLGDHPRTPRLPAELQHLAGRAAMDTRERYVGWMSVFDASARDALLDPEFSRDCDGPSPESVLMDAWDTLDGHQRADQMMGVDIETYLPGDLLVKMDIASMAASVETRSPFLDHELMEFAASLPTQLKVTRAGGKGILKSALRGTLPAEVLDRPKMGFGVPIKHWLREELSELAGQLLLDSAARTPQYLRRAEVERLVAEHARSAADNSIRLWVLLMLEMWHREVLGA